MKTKRNAEGYLLLDHSMGPGLTDDQMRRMDPDAPLGAGRSAYEAPVQNCSHCQKQTMLNPLRTRERCYCRKCDAYICDECGIVAKLHGECRPFRKIMDQAQERAVRGIILGGQLG